MIYYVCPICRRTIWRERDIETNFQFGGVAELVKSLVDAVANQSCESCVNGDGNNFVALCNKCRRRVNMPATVRIGL